MAIADAVERLGRLSLFQGLSPEALQLIGNLAEEKRYSVGETVFQQGAAPDPCYVVERGLILETGVDASGSTVVRLQAGAGQLLGRWAVLNKENHTTTAAALQPTTLLCFRNADLQSALNRFLLLRQRLQRSPWVCRLRAVPLFSSFDDEQLFQVADLAEAVECEMGDVIYRQGDASDCFYVIDSGRVMEDAAHAPSSGEWPRYSAAGAFFGHRSLLQNRRRESTARAETHVKLFRFSAGAVAWLSQLRPAFGRTLERFEVLELLNAARLFDRLSNQELRQLAGYVGLAHYPKDSTLFFQGEIDPTFAYLYEGEAVKRFVNELGQVRPLETLAAGQSVGEKSLFSEEPWGYSLQATAPSNWLYLCQGDLEQFLLHCPAARARLLPADPLAPEPPPKAFDWLGLDEHVRVHRRRHWFALFTRLVSGPTLLWLAVVLALLFWPVGDSAARTLTRIAAVPVALAYVAWRIVDWSNDYFVVTSRRAAYREKVLWVSERLYEVPLGKIQNVNVQQGFIGNLLGFGRLDIDTAATSGVQPLSFKFLAHPNQVHTRIFEEMERARASRRPEARHAIRERLEASTKRGILPSVPKPVSPPVKASQVRTGPLGRIYDATLGAAFWVERRSDTEIVWRKHRIRLLAKVAWPTALMAITLFLFFVLPVPRLSWLPALLVVLAPSAFWWWWRWVDWGNDRYTVTSDRIIDTEKLPLGFRSKRTETIFDRIQNVTYDIPHPIANLLNYGTVSIHTAGTEGILDFPYVPRPREVQAEIFRRIAAHEEEQRRKQQEQFEVGEWFSVYDQTRP